MNTIDGRVTKYKGILNAKFNPLGFVVDPHSMLCIAV